MAAPPCIPRSDAAFRDFASTFCRGIQKSPALYMMSEAEADGLMNNFNRFNAAYDIALDPESRTRAAILDKQDARSILESNLRNYAAFIKPNRGIDDGDKVNIGIPPINVSRRKRKCPATPPSLSYLPSLPGVDMLHFGDDYSESKGKPTGAARLELWAAYSQSSEPRPSVADAQYIGAFKKNPIIVRQDLAKLDAGMQATYWARWAGHNDDVSAWSHPLSRSSAARELQKKNQDAELTAPHRARLAA